MGDNPWVGEVVDATAVSLGELNREGEELIEHCHAVGDVDDLVVACNFGDEVTWVGEV